MTNGLSTLWEKRRESVYGWSLSFVFHGVLGTAALFLMTNILIVQPPEPFRLDMSILKPPPKPVKQPQPVKNTPVEKQIVAQTPVKQQKVQEQHRERVPVEQQVVQKTKTLETPVPKQQPIKSRPVQEVSPANPVTHTVTTQKTVEQTTVTAKRVDSPVPQRQAITSRRVRQNPSKTPVQQRVVAQSSPKTFHRDVSNLPQPTLVKDPQVHNQAAVQQVDVVSHNGTKPTEYAVKSVTPKFEHVAAIVTGSISRSAPTFRKPPSTQTLVSTHTVPPARTPSVQSVPRSVVQQAVITKAQPTVVTRDVKQYPTPTADYGWVANALLEKVQQLKRYPSRAKRREWEGTVELRVSIRDNGEILEVRIIESSGHKTLDQEALKTVKLASPLTLQHSLDRSIVMVDLPLMYKLN